MLSSPPSLCKPGVLGKHRDPWGCWGDGSALGARGQREPLVEVFSGSFLQPVLCHLCAPPVR